MQKKKMYYTVIVVFLFLFVFVHNVLKYIYNVSYIYVFKKPFSGPLFGFGF
jgi:hypothetical protein